MSLIHSAFDEMVLKYGTQQIRFPTSPDTGHYFYQSVIFSLYQLVQIIVSFYLFFHNNPQSQKIFRLFFTKFSSIIHCGKTNFKFYKRYLGKLLPKYLSGGNYSIFKNNYLNVSHSNVVEILYFSAISSIMSTTGHASASTNICILFICR